MSLNLDNHRLCEEVNFGDNYSKFKLLCDCYPSRKKILAGAILSGIGSFIEPNRPLSVLDVGSSDGELLCEVLSSPPFSAVPSLSCVSLEPDPSAFSQLEISVDQFFWRTGKPIDCRLETWDGYISSSSAGAFDIILCTHVFYHFADWRETLQQLAACLTPGGILVITLDRSASPLYQWWLTLTAETAACEQTLDYGFLRFAEDLQSLIESMSISCCAYDIDLELMLPLTEDGRPQPKMLEVIEFLLRLNPTNNSTIKNKVEAFSALWAKDGYCSIPWSENVMVVRG